MNTGNINVLSKLKAYILDKLQDNIMLNAFRIAINGSLTQFNMIDGIVDEYEDESGIAGQETVLLLHLNGSDQAVSTIDESDSSHIITFNGTAQLDTTIKKIGTASLLLDGNSDYLTIPDSDDFNFGSTDFTIESWIYLNSSTGFQHIFSAKNAIDGSVDLIQFGLDSTGQYLRAVITKSSSQEFNYTGNISISQSTWTHVAMVRNGDTITFYVDGVNSGSSTLTTNYVMPNTASDPEIGRDSKTAGAVFFDGQIDEYRISKGIARWTSGFTPPSSEHNINNETHNISYNSSDDYYEPTKDSLTTSPYAHYKMNDNLATTTVIDTGTGANNGVGNVNTSNYSVTGKINEAFEFNGTSEYINLDALEADIDSDTTGTISLWIKSANTSTGQTVFGLADTSIAWYFRINVYTGGALQVILRPPSATDWRHTTTSVITTGIWYHIVVVQDGVSPKIYLNGSDITALDVTTDTTTWFAVNEVNFDNARLGCENQGAGNNSFFNGQIDDFRYYKNKALTSSEVLAIYNLGTGTEDDKPSTPKNMTLISDSFTAEAEADTSRIVLLEEDVDSITLNTDLKAYASRDGGSSWVQGTISDEGDYDSSKQILVADFDLTQSGIGTGTDMKYKLESLNNKDLKIHGTSLNWD